MIFKANWGDTGREGQKFGKIGVTLFMDDLLQIPYGNTATIAAITSPGVETSFVHRVCGRYFSTITDDENSLTVCCEYIVIHLFVFSFAFE